MQPNDIDPSFQPNPLDSLGYLSPSSKGSKALLNSLYQKGSKNDDLLAIAKKSRPDQVKLSHFILKKRMADSLDKVLQQEFKKFPELKGNIHIGILTDNDLSVEVVEKQRAIDAASDVSKEEAEQLLSANPVGYYLADDFQLSTPSSESHHSMKKSLEGFFKKNSGVIQYLREHPENDVDLQQLLQ